MDTTLPAVSPSLSKHLLEVCNIEYKKINDIFKCNSVGCSKKKLKDVLKNKRLFYCKKHRKDTIYYKKCIGLHGNNCDENALYKYPGTKRRVYCYKHKME